MTLWGASTRRLTSKHSTSLLNFACKGESDLSWPVNRCTQVRPVVATYGPKDPYALAKNAAPPPLQTRQPCDQGHDSCVALRPSLRCLGPPRLLGVGALEHPGCVRRADFRKLFSRFSPCAFPLPSSTGFSARLLGLCQFGLRLLEGGGVQVATWLRFLVLTVCTFGEEFVTSDDTTRHPEKAARCQVRAVS